MTLQSSDGVAGVRIVQTSLQGATRSLIAAAMGAESGAAYRLVNSYSIALADKDPAYGALLREGGVNLPDGKPLAAVLRWRTGQQFGQVRGPSLFVRCLDEGRSLGVRHYFLGGTADLLHRLTSRAESQFPGLRIAGSYAPPFRALTPSEVNAQDDLIRAAKPDVVWVGLGTPRQDFEADRLAKALNVTAVGVGAAFDFFAQTKHEAPAWVQALGMEWSFRLMSEPRRLWRRYLFGNAKFVQIAWRERQVNER